MNRLRAAVGSPFHDACTRAHPQPATPPCRQPVSSPHRAAQATPLGLPAARVQRVTISRPHANDGRALRFFSLQYRPGFAEAAGLVLGLLGALVVGLCKVAGLLP